MPRPLIVSTSPACTPARSLEIHRSVERLDRGRRPQDGVGHRDLESREQIVAVAAERLVRRHGDLEVQVAVRSARGTHLARARAAAGAGRSRHPQGCRARRCDVRARAPDPGTSRTGTEWSCRSPGTSAGLTGDDVAEQAAHRALHMTGAAADVAGHRGRAGLAARALACLAQHRRVDLEVAVHSEHDVLEVEGDAHQSVLTALAPRSRTPGALPAARRRRRSRRCRRTRRSRPARRRRRTASRSRPGRTGRAGRGRSARRTRGSRA